MIEESCRLPASLVGAGVRFRVALVGVSLGLALMGSNAARAQITTQTLIGDSVSEIGTKYSDIDEAIKRFTNRDVLAARQFLESAKKKDANLPPVDLLLAKMYFLSGNAAAGRASLEKTAMDNPEDPEAYLVLADQAVQQGRMIEADALYERGLALTSKYSGNAKRKRNFEIRSRSGSAAVNQRRKNWDGAAADLKALLQADPENAAGHYRLGQTLCMLQKFQDGFNEFTAAKKADKNLPDPNVATAMMYDQLKITDKAQQFLERALTTNKTDPATLTAYAQWLIKSGSPEALAKADALLADARKANPGNLNLLILSGVSARMLKKMKPAEDYFVEAHGISPDNGDVINQLALLLTEQDNQAKRTRGLQFANMGAMLNNQSADAQVTLAWVLYQLARTSEAEAALRQGLQLGNLSPDSSYLVAKILVEQNRGDTAKQILTSALEADNAGIFIYRKDAEALLKTLK